MKGTLTVHVTVEMTQYTPDPEALLQDVSEALYAVSSKYERDLIVFDSFVFVNNDSGNQVFGGVHVK